jgi:hypothetical protein
MKSKRALDDGQQLKSGDRVIVIGIFRHHRGA